MVIMHVGEGATPTIPGELSAREIEVEFVVHRPPSEMLALVRGTFGRWPYTLTRFHSAEFESGLRRAVEAWSPDLVFINNLHLAIYTSALGRCVRVLRQHNLEQ